MADPQVVTVLLGLFGLAGAVLTFVGVRGQTRVTRDKNLWDASDQVTENLREEVDRLNRIVTEQRLELGERDLIIGEQGVTIAELRAQLDPPTPRRRAR